MRAYNQLDDATKQRYDDKYGDVEGGGQAFYEAYVASKRGKGDYASAYKNFENTSDKASNDLYSKYEAKDNRIDYKNFSDEQKSQFAADKAAMTDKYYSVNSYQDFLYKKMMKDGSGGELPQDPPDSGGDPNPTPDPTPTPTPPPDNDDGGGGGQNPSPSPSSGGGGTGNQSGNSGHGSGNTIIGDGNAVGIGNVAIGDFIQNVGNKGDTNINIEGSTFGDGASIGNDYSQNNVSNKFGLTLNSTVQKQAKKGAFGTEMAGGLVFS